MLRLVDIVGHDGFAAGEGSGVCRHIVDIQGCEAGVEHVLMAGNGGGLEIGDAAVTGKP